ncbi:hypothetical protein [Devosia sp. XK-2]|uniref:hypothetical protein n=1 Tax=Devosia sp. XK-2 TaxID=3126689 RepID=UPI0030D487BF
MAKDESNFGSPRVPSPHFDQVQFQANTVRRRPNENVAPDRATVHKLVDLIESKILLAEPSLTSEPADSAAGALAQTFAKLNDRFSDLNAEAEARRSEVDREYKERQQEFEAHMRARETELETRQAELEALHAARMEELEALKKTLDDRDHMHARRSLREAITSDIQDKLARALIPRTSLVYRLAVLIAVLSGAAISAAFALLSYGDFSATWAQQAAMETEPTWSQVVTTWMLFGKGSIGSLAALGFLVYAINWLRKSYNDDLRAHRDLERYAIDLNRASWAIETILEANSKEGVQIPEIMIEGVSRNLFGTQEQKADAKSDAIAELLRASARAKIGPGGAEFELGRRGTKKLADEME